METTKQCPACKKEIGSKAAKCPACQRQISGPCWEVRQNNNTRTFYFGDGLEKAIEKDLLQESVKLSDYCRQYVRTLKNISGDNEEYEITNETSWAPLKTYTDKVPELQGLYSPVKAFSNLGAGAGSEVLMVLCVIGFVVAGIRPTRFQLQKFLTPNYRFHRRNGRSRDWGRLYWKDIRPNIRLCNRHSYRCDHGPRSKEKASSA